MTSERNPNIPIENLAIGKIIEVDGTHIVAELDLNIQELSRIFAGEMYPIGQFGSIVKIHFGRRHIYGYVGRLRMKIEYEKELGITLPETSNVRIIEADLFGEGEWVLNTESTLSSWELHFERGVSTFPLPQQILYLTLTRELRFIYGHGKGAFLKVGEHVGSGGTPCYVDMNELLGKHTAILGSTGAGKSGSVAAILHSILERGSEMNYINWKPNIVILDPHNEYGVAFPKHRRLSADEGKLILPYWLLNFQEVVSLIIGKTEFVATSQSNIIKVALLNARVAGAKQVGVDSTKITVDSPTPYSLDKFKEEINAQRPDNKNKKDHEPFDHIIQKLDILQRDSRMNFLMAPWDNKTDQFPYVISQFIGNGESIRIVDLSGVPNELAGIASAVIARTLFNFKLWQNTLERESTPTLLVCEEAHRYVPNRGEAQYEAAQDAIRRIAKEGRKYGIGLMLVSQRPSEVEATVLSQCNSWIILRITNESDREHVRSILPDSLSGLTKILSGLRRQEAIIVGQAVMLPSRILISSLEREKLPRSHDIDFDKGWQAEIITKENILETAERWRYQVRL